MSTLAVIRYADDFVVLHENLDIILQCQQIIVSWLSEVGLALSPVKTRITHTLALTEKHKLQFGLSLNHQPGFDFLGFTIRQFYTKYKSAYTNKKPLGYRTLIYPSKNKQIEHLRTIKRLLRKKRNLPKSDLIKLLNPVITGWVNYFGVSDGLQTNTLQKLDHLLYLKLMHLVKRNKGDVAKYWKTIGSSNWVFSPQNSDIRLVKYSSHTRSIHDYVKVKGEASPFDGQALYWATRLGNSPDLPKCTATLLKRQLGVCALCKLHFTPEDVLEVDHIIPQSQSGKNSYENLQLLHRHCHDSKTLADIRSYSDKVDIYE